MIHLNEDLGIEDFPSIGVGEIRVYHPIEPPTIEPPKNPFNIFLGKGENISLKLRRKIQDRYVIAERERSGTTTSQPNLLDELLTLGALEQNVSFQEGTGRALLALCYGQRYVNATIRKADKDMGSASWEPHYTSAQSRWKWITTEQETHAKGGDKKAVDCTIPDVATRSKGKIDHLKIRPEFAPNTGRGAFRFSFHDLCAAIVEQLPRAKDTELPLPGLIVIAGGTGSGKSEIIRGLIHYFLNNLVAEREDIPREEEKQKEKKKHPHLLTVENPIEKYLFTYAAGSKYQENGVGVEITEANKGGFLLPQHVQDYLGIDYTPRQMPEDTPSLEQALMRDALRQTPDLVYVGEIREPHEFKTVLDFAETGHAVITTMHAGSLREAMQRILAGAGAETPAQRGAIATRINAVIHIEKMPELLGWQKKQATAPSPVSPPIPPVTNPVTDKEETSVPAIAKTPATDATKEKVKLAVTLPAMWFQTNSAIANLVADGLSSLSPSRNKERSTKPGEPNAASYCLGRSYFLETLEKNLKEDLDKRVTRDEDSYRALLEAAIQHDMG